jgi:tRNA U55 pseudouridine synthase TruB
VGEFSIDRAVTLDRLRDARQEGKAPELLIPLPQLLTTFLSVTLTAADAREIAHGKDLLRKLDAAPSSRFVKLMEPGGSLMAIGEIVDRHSIIVTIHPTVVLAHM